MLRLLNFITLALALLQGAISTLHASIDFVLARSVLNDAEATLLRVKSYGAQSGAFYAHTDTQDNVAGLVNSADGSIAAWYEYGPFGEAIRANGSMALENPIRFSSKLK